MKLVRRISIFLILVGFLITLTPTFTDLVYQSNVNSINNSFNKAIEGRVFKVMPTVGMNIRDIHEKAKQKREKQRAMLNKYKTSGKHYDQFEDVSYILNDKPKSHFDPSKVFSRIIKGNGKPATKTHSKTSVKSLSELYNKLFHRNLKYLDKRALTDFTGIDSDDISLSDYGLNCLGFIHIPTISVELPIYLGGVDSNLERGACHITGTSYPLGGIGTNSVIVAHRNYTWSKMFRNISTLNKNALVILDMFFGEKLFYRVSNKYIVNFKDKTPTQINPNKDLLTLATCEWNKSKATYDRYIVVCERVR